MRWLAPLLLCAAVVIAYANTFAVPFVFDDIYSIPDNPTIRHLWPLRDPLSPPTDWGFTVSGRPVLNLSLALNYAISGVGVWSYHAVNLLIHALATLTLFGLVRRTLLRWRPEPAFAGCAPWLAFFVALLWGVHPLQTEAVTYVVQRAESLMGLFFLLTLYAFVRSIESRRPWLWQAAAVIACLLGVGTKEVAALAPLFVLLYDRTFVSGSFRAAWRRHRWTHLALAATWLPLAWLFLATGGDRGGTMRLDLANGLSYWPTQVEALLRYGQLALWPHPQVFEYGKVAPPGILRLVLGAVPVVGCMGATIIALWRWPVAGFAGAWFFGLLAPTSVVPGILQMIVEHRMYLSLAAIVALLVAAAHRVLGWRTFVPAGCAVAAALVSVTAARNDVYRDEERLWQDTLAKRPENARAHNNLGLVFYRTGRLEEARAEFAASVRLDPGEAHARFNLGLAGMRTGRLAEARENLAAAIQILPYYVDARVNLGIVLTKLGEPEAALDQFAAAVHYKPDFAEAHVQWGATLAQLGRWREAADHDAIAVQLEPRSPIAHSNRAVALFNLNDMPAAITEFEAALALDARLPDVHFNFGQALAAAGRNADALAHYAEAVRLAPSHADGQLNLGIALAQAGKLPEAIEHLREAVRLRPEAPVTHTNLATALDEAGDLRGALEHYETALRLQPGEARAHYNVGYALLRGGREAEARTQLEIALRLDPNFAAAREMLGHLAR